MSGVDHERIAKLLQDPSLSYRAIGRQLGLSDWTVRKVARELDGDSRPMKQRRSRFEEPAAEDASAALGWFTFGIVVAGLVLAIWVGSRWAPPPE